MAYAKHTKKNLQLLWKHEYFFYLSKYMTQKAFGNSAEREEVILLKFGLNNLLR